MKTIAKICCLILVMGFAAQAEIEKTAQMCDTGICLYWWPKLPQISGWHQDVGSSYSYGVNTLAPDGSTFANADAVMYAGATYKPREPETKSLEMYIANDQKHFQDTDPSIAIAEVGALPTGDGAKMRSFTFFPKSKGNWEQVTYGEEGDYYLVFTLSARSKESFDAAQPAYRDLIAHYKAKP